MWHIFCYMWMTSYWQLHPTIFSNILFAPCRKNLLWLILVIFITSWVLLPSSHPQVCSSLKLNMLLKFWTRPICQHAILAEPQLRFIPSCLPKMDHRLLILLYIAVLLVPYNIWHSHGWVLLMPFNKFACICMTPMSPILLSSNAFCNISKAPWSTVLLFLAASHMIWSSTRMLIGQAAQTPAALLLGIVSFLAIILYCGRPSANTLSQGPVLRPNTGVLLMPWLRLVGFVNSWASFVVLYHVLYCDNISAMYLLTNPVHNQRTKHVEIDVHFVREHVALGALRVLHVPTSLQYADIFTKELPTDVFINFRSSLNVRSCPGWDCGRVLEYEKPRICRV